MTALLSGGRPGSAAPLEILGLDQIRPGMKGHGLTVFSGFKVEQFQVQVIDVLKNFLPKQDLFLVRVDHPVLRRTGVVGGMSGSPVFINGKLAGALAYGYRFAKEPVAGITPIASMLELLQYKLRGPDRAGYVLEDGRRPAGRLALAARARRDRWWRPVWLHPDPQPEDQLAPVSVPLNAAGFTAGGMALLKDSFSRYGFEPVQGGGTGQAEGPTSYQAGGVLGVQLISGDISISTCGTVTYSSKNQVLGFGHRMFNAGEIYLPAVTSKVVHTLASLSRSFKICSPARPLGTLVQDRQAGVVVDATRRIGTVPLRITMRTPGRTQIYRLQLARHRLLTATLANTAISNALDEALPDVTRATFSVVTRLEVQGQRPVRIKEFFYTPSGVRMPLALFSRGPRAVSKVLDNPFEPAILSEIDVEIEAKFDSEVAEITEVRLGSSIVEPGARVNLMVSFRPFGGQEFTKTYPLMIPPDLAGSVLVVEVASGAQVQPDRATPQNLSQMLRSLQDGYPARSVVISLQTPTQGVKLRGRVIRELPASALDILNTGTQVRTEELFRSAIRWVHGTRRVISGKRSIRIRVRNEVRQ